MNVNYSGLYETIIRIAQTLSIYALIINPKKKIIDTNVCITLAFLEIII
jgi:hypothetical protein